MPMHNVVPRKRSMERCKPFFASPMNQLQALTLDPQTNPYAPGAGTSPPELAGRDSILDEARIAIQRNRLGLLPRHEMAVAASMAPAAFDPDMAAAQPVTQGGDDGGFADPTVGLASSKTRDCQCFAGKGMGRSSGSFLLGPRLCSRKWANAARSSWPASNALNSNSYGFLSPRNDS